MADTKIYLASQPLISVGGQTLATAKTTEKNSASFADILAVETGKLTFSQHALQRMQSRKINLSTREVQQLTQAVNQVAQKGAKESLVYLNDKAFVVSVVNKTVITAMDGMSARNNVFTNIDSAVIL
jgi:flagellar operon protein